MVSQEKTMSKPFDTAEQKGNPSQPDASLEGAWEAVVANWDNEELHKAFVGACLAAGRLPEAGKRYRKVKLGGGPKAERAEKQIGKLLTLGMTLIEQHRTPAPKKRNHLVTLLVLLALVFLGTAIALGLPDR